MSQAQAVPVQGAAQLISDLLGVGNPGDLNILFQLCGDFLVNEEVTNDLVLHTLTCLKSRLYDVSEETWQGIVSRAIVAVKRLMLVDEDAAVHAIELLDEFIHDSMPVINDFVKFCTQIIDNKGKDRHGDKLIGKALTLLDSVIISWSASDGIEKLKLIEPILRTVFTVMCSNKTETERETLDDLACQVVYTMSPYLTKEQVIHVFFKYMTRSLENPSSSVRRAAFMALAACCRGSKGTTGRHYLMKYVDNFLFPIVYTGLSDPSAEVCLSALVALGQYPKLLQPNISVHLATTLHPRLFTCLGKITNDLTMSYKDMKNGFTALIMICESLHREILSYLDELMRFLLDVMESAPDQMKALALEALGSIAEAAGPDLAPYLSSIRACFNRFLNVAETKQQILSTASLCLATVAKYVGEKFSPYNEDLLSVGLALMELVQKLKLRGFDDSVHITETKQACLALDMIARSAGVQFLPYIKQTHNEILPLLKHSTPSIRSSSATCIGDLCCALWSSEKERDVNELGTDLSYILHITVSTYISMIRSDKRRGVIIDILKSLDVMLKEIGSPVIKHAVPLREDGGVSDGGQTAVLKAMTVIYKRANRCLEDCGYYYDMDEEENDHFDLLFAFESLLPSLARLIEDGAFKQFFIKYFNSLLPGFFESEGRYTGCDLMLYVKSFTDVVKNMSNTSAASLVDRYYAMVMGSLDDENVGSRSDACGTLGILVACGGESTSNKYSDTLEAFNEILSSETSIDVIDKVYAAIFGMISSNQVAVPMMDYLPAVITRLPLTPDCYDNNEPVFQCVLNLYRSSTLPHIEGLLVKLIFVAGQLLDESRIDRKLRTLLVEFLSEMERKEQAVLSRVLEEASLGTQRSIRACLSEGSWSGRARGGMAHFI